MGSITQEQLTTAVIGMLIVFAVLGAVWIIMEIMRRLIEKPLKKKVRVTEKTEAQVAVPVQELTVSGLSEELVAVITAAIAASMGTSTERLKIKSLKRMGDWYRTVRQERLY